MSSEEITDNTTNTENTNTDNTNTENTNTENINPDNTNVDNTSVVNAKAVLKDTVDITGLMSENLGSLVTLWNKPDSSIVIEPTNDVDLAESQGVSTTAVFKIVFTCTEYVSTAYIFHPGTWCFLIEYPDVAYAMLEWTYQLRELPQ